MKKITLLSTLLASGVLLSACGTSTGSSEIKITTPAKLTAVQRCEVTSADLIKAVANFKSHNPHTVVTTKGLESNIDGGPFITALPRGSNYRFVIASYGLRKGYVAIVVKNVYQSKPVYFSGPKMCTLITLKKTPTVPVPPMINK